MAMCKTSVTLDETLLAEARAHGVNIAAACRAGLDRAVREARTVALKAEIAEALDDRNRYIAEHGLPLGKHRLF